MPAEALASLEVGRCSSFSWRSTQKATFMVLFTSWGFQRSLSSPPLICQSSHPTSHMQRQRHGPFKMHKIEIWEPFYSHIFWYSLLQTLHFIPSYPHPCPDSLFLHIFRYNYGGSLQMPPSLQKKHNLGDKSSCHVTNQATDKSFWFLRWEGGKKKRKEMK